MTLDYYGPTAEAEIAVNRLLQLQATGNEQDWEFECAEPTKINEMLELFTTKELDLECKSALALLIISSLEQAAENGKVDEVQVVRITQLLENNEIIRSRMFFYWILCCKAINISLVKRILEC